MEYRICSKGIGEYKRYKAQKKINILGINFWLTLFEVFYDWDGWEHYSKKREFENRTEAEMLIIKDRQKRIDNINYHNKYKKQPIKCEGFVE